MATTSVTTSTSVRPKERQFQVVPVPAVFTRGRWECIDYKDGGAGPNGSVNFTLGPAPSEQTIEFDKSANNAVNSATPTPLGTQTGAIGGNGTTVQEQQQQQTNAQNVSEPLTPIAAPAQQPPPPQPQASNGAALPANSSVPHFEISPSHSVPTTLTDIVVAQPCISSADSSIVTNGSGNTSTTAATPAAQNAPPPICGGAGPNAVAIDNKIEQAMDLVKTHLTFAVREEVEILRSTITDLESKVSLLENENQILRQFAPADVVATLPALVQAAQQQQQKIAAAVSAAQQQKTFQTVPSAPVIMDPHLLQQQHPPQQSQTAPPAAQTQLPKQQQQKPPVPPAQQQQQSPSPGPSGDEML